MKIYAHVYALITRVTQYARIIEIIYVLGTSCKEGNKCLCLIFLFYVRAY
jgi:hypothetical protein